MKSQGLTKANRIHPLGSINICVGFHGSPSNICWDFSGWTKAVDRPADTAIPRAIPLAWLKIKCKICYVKKKKKKRRKTGRVSINICNILSLSVRGSQEECAAQIKGLISTLLTSYSVSSGRGLMGRLCRDLAGA